MKKVISLLVVVTIISSLLVGCDWINSINTEAHNQAQSLPDNPNVEVVGDFSEDDIEFVKTLHGKQIKNDVGIYDYPDYTIGKIIDVAKAGSPLFLMHFENPYVICAYLKVNNDGHIKPENGSKYLDITKYVWYKFYDVKSMPKVIDGMKKTSYSYLLYDCTIISDIANSVEYNRQCKYYLKYSDESSFQHTTTDMIMYFLGVNIGELNKKFIMENPTETTRYQVYTDGSGVQYLVLLDEEYHSDEGRGYPLAQIFLEEYYDYLYPYFVENESLEVKRMHQNGVDFTIYKYKQIELDLFVDLLFNTNGE